MIDLSNMRGAGWQRVVSDLASPAPDERIYLLRLLNVLGQVAGARQAVLYLPQEARDDGSEGPEPQAVALWPFAPEVVDAQGRLVAGALDSLGRTGLDPASILRAPDAKSAARQALASKQVMVFAVEGGSGGGSDEPGFYGSDQPRPSIIAAAIPGGIGGESPTPIPRAVVTLLIEPRSRPALQTTLALVEVLAGYVYGHAAQQGLLRVRATSASLELATRLIAAINTAQGFRGATIQLVNDLCRHLQADRAALGWVHGIVKAARRGTIPDARRGCRCVALSDTENVDRRMAMVRALEEAMNECLDQEQTILHPPPPATGPDADPVLAQGITHAHRALTKNDARIRVASFPLRTADEDGERVLGVITVESAAQGGPAQGGAGETLDLAKVELLQAALDLVTPVLRVRHSDDRTLAGRTWDWAVRTAAWAVGPKHTVWKAAGVLVMLGVTSLFLFSTTYRIGAAMELRPADRRTIASPFDGVIAALGPGVEPGAKVQAGQVLLTMDTTELSLSLLEAQSQIVQFEKQADDELRRNALAEHQQALAKAEQARARARLLEHQLSRASVLAPMDATIIAGDLEDRVGASVKLGETLFELADLKTMRVIARVSDSDIAMISPGQTGEIAPKAAPSRHIPFTVERIVPLAQPVDGSNAFEVHGVLTSAEAWLAPGMEGRAKFDGPHKSLAWIASRRLLDTARLWLWW